MAGTYIHIPFCRQACYYCNFHFTTTLRNMNEMADAIVREAVLRKDYLGSAAINTIYFGGGTPSIYEPRVIARILQEIRSIFTAGNPPVETTIEVNPDDVTEELMEAYLEAGVNRLSIGVQSFHDAELAYMNRIHNGGQAANSISIARKAGFANISIDLIYGAPTLTSSSWKKNLDMAVKSGVPHISAYCLTVEPKTALAYRIKAGKAPGVDDEASAAQFETLIRHMEEHGFLHYEISNFCRPGNFSRHNTSYWLGEKYIGLGPGAHSYDGESRQWNVANNTKYIRNVSAGEPFFETEQLTPLQKYNEYVLTRMRTMWGCDVEEAAVLFGKEFSDYMVKAAQTGSGKELLETGNGKILLTTDGKLFADKVIGELMMSP